MTSRPSAHATSQYATTTGNLTARWLAERLPFDGDVVEVGAGTGDLWTRVDHLARGLSLTLTDFSPAMCARLRAIPGAVVLRCDASGLPFADAALREFARVLRPRGRVAITVNGAGHLAELEAIGPVLPGWPTTSPASPSSATRATSLRESPAPARESPPPAPELPAAAHESSHQGVSLRRE